MLKFNTVGLGCGYRGNVEATGVLERHCTYSSVRVRDLRMMRAALPGSETPEG